MTTQPLGPSDATRYMALAASHSHCAESAGFAESAEHAAKAVMYAVLGCYVLTKRPEVCVASAQLFDPARGGR